VVQREALSHYQGDFLRGLSLPNAALFEEWALVRREQLRGLALDGLSALAQASLAQGEYTQAIADLRRLLALDPWREAAHRALMRAWAAGGDRAAALAQFEQCRQTLADELGVEPAPATVLLYEQIKAGTYVAGDIEDRFSVSAAPTSRSSPHNNLPAETTPFVGRQAELAQIAERLAEPGCRLLTLFGPGGIGKTRLALQAARQAANTFTDGVCLVSLEAVETADHLPTAIATALKIPLSGRREPRAQLLAYLLERELLLVLDNFEHLLPETELLTEILEHAAGVKLLVTSLAALNLYEEWVLAIEGLPHPAEADVADLSGFEAVTLFRQRARQVQAAFDLAGNEAGVLTICRLLQGMPLGIELAAASVRTRSPAQIARQIEADLSTLATSLRNVPARQRSMVAVFDHAWRLLPAEERQLLRRLTLFRGGFTAAAAREVLGAAPPALAGLVSQIAAASYGRRPLPHPSPDSPVCRRENGGPP
jgi:tetratricopeptide (TPR) repeat protein